MGVNPIDAAIPLIEWKCRKRDLSASCDAGSPVRRVTSAPAAWMCSLASETKRSRYFAMSMAVVSFVSWARCSARCETLDDPDDLLGSERLDDEVLRAGCDRLDH